MVPASADGWRWALLIGAAPVLYAVFVRLRLPESVRFLESRGRHDEAEPLVRRFRNLRGAQRRDRRNHNGIPPRCAPGSAELWAPRATPLLAALWAGLVLCEFLLLRRVAKIWLPTILVASGFSLVRSFGFTLLVQLRAAARLCTSRQYLIEKYGGGVRRWPYS